MQTFLPYADFEQSAECLDMRRLGKQRVEVLQLLTAMTTGPEKKVKLGNSEIVRVTPWYNHPAAKMWRGYEQALVHYGFVIIEEWLSRGYKDTCHDKLCVVVGDLSDYWDPDTVVLPPWLGNEDFHAAHRSNLLRKDPVWYGQFGWTEPNDLPYIWPVS